MKAADIRKEDRNEESDSCFKDRILSQMSISVCARNGKKLRVLVVIASYGEKNLSFLNRVIQQYRSMDLDLEIVVVSEAPKSLDGVEKVVVGLPSANPWSLPFAHKKIFAEKLDNFDLFIYTEDDIEVSWQNIEAFVNVTAELKDDEIAGFIRYELSRTGAYYLPDCHGHYHWDPNSVRRRGPHMVAEFTNEHAGFYILTQKQLRKVIASGGFLRAPCDGRYGMPETAATDPYTNSGFRKVVCISTFENFLVHHMPNRYVGLLGLPMSEFQQQVQTLREICDGIHPATVLCDVESKILHREWSKSYYEEPSSELLQMVPGTGTILSIGCGWGTTEAALGKRGALITALPLDSVIGAAAAKYNHEMVYGSLGECFERLDGRNFDCVLMMDLIHLQAGSHGLLERLSKFVKGNGTIVIGSPNFQRAPVVFKRLLKKEGLEKLSEYSTGGVQTWGPREFTAGLRMAGFDISMVRWYDYPIKPATLRAIAPRLGRLAARRWVLQARRTS